MKQKHKDFCIVNSIALVLGGLCIYIYISFVGFSFAFLMEQELYRKFMFMFCNFGEMRAFLFKFFSFLQDIIFLLIVFVPFLYWFSEKLRTTMPLSIVSFLIGALIGDYLLFFSFSKNFPDMGPDLFFSYSIFFENTFLCYLQNLGVWGGVFYASISIGTYLKPSSRKAV